MKIKNEEEKWEFFKHGKFCNEENNLMQGGDTLEILKK
jgi:hypothetical protein